jgi:pimeloyl-ACP methyl ester carboxylesterase
VNASGGLDYDRYQTSGTEEWLMRIGPTGGAPILFVPPLFEEMNRTRALIASTMRLLAARGHGCWLPDLPGTGESAVPLQDCSWEDWREAVADAAKHIEQNSDRPPLIASIRGGALIDDAAGGIGYWRFAPAEGASLARDMVRASMLKPEEMQGPEVQLAGYRMGSKLLEELGKARPAALDRLRVVRLASDRAEADLKVEGPALWRRSEPANSPLLAEALASDLGQWCNQCAVS